MAQKMRNPGYYRAEAAWEHDCAVLINGIDFGPNLLYSKLKFTPGAIKEHVTNIPGMPGRRDDSDKPGGYCVPDNLTGTLALWVRDAAAWGMPGITPDGYMSPEARFLAQLSNKCKLEFLGSNGFYLIAKCTLTKYERFDLGFRIEMKLTCDPYWWEQNRAVVEFELGQQGSTNLFNPSTATINSELLPVGQSCTWEDGEGSGGWYLLHADPGLYATVTVSGLDATKRYRAGARKIFSAGDFWLYDQNGQHVLNEFTGVTSLTFRLISRASAYLAVGFADPYIFEVGPSTETGQIVTLDAPLQTIYVTSSGQCDMILNGERVKLPVGDAVPVYGLNIPPRTTVPVQFVSDVACYGFIGYQRGARSCTL